jgi:hypothetical protein
MVEIRGNVIVNGEYLNILKEVAMGYFQVMSAISSAGSRQLVLRFERRTADV